MNYINYMKHMNAARLSFSNLFSLHQKRHPKLGVFLAQKERFPRLAFALADRHPDSEQSTGLF